MRRRLLLAGLLAAMASILAGAAALAAAPPDVSGVSLSGDADASAVEMTILATTFSTSTPVFDGQYPHAHSDVASSVQAVAHGSIFDPGAGVQSLPYEVDSNCPPPSPFPATPPPGGCQQFPAYPFGATADNGSPHAAGSVAGKRVGPLTFAAGSYDLAVAPGSADAQSTGGSASFAAPQAVTFSSGWAEASVRTEGAEVISQVHSRLKGVVIDGAIDIAAIDSTATTTSISGRQGAAQGALTVTGVTVAGEPAAIDQDGIHLLGQTLPLQLDPARQLLQSLQQAGTSVTLLQPDRQVATGHSSYTSSAVQVTETSKQDGSSFSILLGPSRGSTVAVPFNPPGLQSLGAGLGPAPPAPPGSLPAGGGAAPGSGGPSGGGTVWHLAGLALTPRQLLIALAVLLEVALAALALTLFWPRPPAPRVATLRPL